MLTITAVKAARPRAAAFKIFDQGGLFLYVAPTGLRSFRLRFRLAGREQLLTIGSWPELSLDEARIRAAAAREQLGRGEDPRVCGTTQDRKLATFETIARRWHVHMLRRWTPVHAADVMASLERDVFPAIGAMPLSAITVPVVLSALRVVEERGRLETARRVRQRISAVFVFAMSEGLVETDPAAIVGRALIPPAPPRHQPALLDLGQARELLAAVDQLAAARSTTLASRFLALTAVRLAAVRGARWSEIEDLDGPAPLWRVPAARMKLAAAKKTDARNDHLVPLAQAAVDVLRAAQGLCVSPASDKAACVTSSAVDDTQLIFPGRDAGRPIGEAAIGALYDRAGYAGRHVPHGWRATFSTVMNEGGAFDRGLIDRALAHAAKDKVEAAYNRAELLDQRRALFAAWADALVA